MNNSISEEVVLDALRGVMDPELGHDIVSLGMVEDLNINGEKVSFKLILTTPACPLRDVISANARQAVLSIEGIKDVAIQVGAKVRSDGKQRSVIQSSICNVIAVGSGKGGVGKTTVAVNLAVALAKMGASVGLLDADIYGPNIPMMMGINSTPVIDGDRLMPVVAYGVKVMSIGFLVKPGQPIIWRGPLLDRTIKQFLGDVNWGDLDYLIIDLPPGTGDVQLSLAQSIQLSGGVIVTLPQQVSTDDAHRGINFFNELKIPVIGVVENMSYLELPDGSQMDIFGQGGGERLAQLTGVPFLGGIPIDSFIRSGSDEGKPVIISRPDSVSANALQAIASAVSARLSMMILSNSK